MDLSLMVNPLCSSMLRMKMRRDLLSFSRVLKSLKALSRTGLRWLGIWNGNGDLK